MITSKTIDELYRRYRRQPKRLDERNLSLLIDYALDTDAVELDGDLLVFTRLEQNSPFRSIELERIHGVVDLDEAVAVVLPHSIIFIDKRSYDTHAHIKANPTGFFGKLRYMLEK